MRALAPLLVLLVAGCLGTDHVFPDESDKVVALHVNAYDKVRNDATLEITGHDGGNVTRAFAGTIHLLLQEQHDPPSPPTYSVVKEWTITLGSADFSNPGNHPIHVETIPRATFPEAGTYKIVLDATVGGRHLPPEMALFYAEP